jgi:serine/threonine-protein kinase RsbW
MPATLQAVESFCADFRRKSHAMAKRVNCFAVELLVREALTNAVVHGCHTDPNKQVRCSVRLKGGRLLIAVDDDGEGFDWREVRDRRAKFSDCSGRGIEILRSYANRIRYNDRGNSVALVFMEE